MSAPIHRIGRPLPQPRFSGHRVQEDGIRLFLPGREPENDQTRMEVRYHHGSAKKSRTQPMVWTGRQWELPSGVALKHDQDLHYVFVQQTPGQPEQVIHDNAYQKGGFNLIPAGSPDPASLGPNVLVFRDSIVPEETLSAIAQTAGKDTTRFVRTHANRLGGSEKADLMLQQLCQKYGFKSIEERPLIGGDNISAHGYWTTSLFQLNNKVSGPGGLEKLALANLESGMRMFFDGAFVNEGLQGVHYLSNLYYGKNSPNLNWFDYGQLNQFPYQPLKLGILPVKQDPVTGEDVVNPKAWDIRFIPSSSSDGMFFIETYDPRLEDAQGKPYPPEVQQRNLLKDTGCPFLTNSQDTIQKYRFPISEEEYEEKKHALGIARKIPDKQGMAQELQRLKREWENFELTISVEDASGYNWDGQRDVKKLNMKNPDVIDYVKNACSYWTDKIDCLYTQHVAKALSGKLPKDQPVTATVALHALEAITQKDLGQPGVLPALNRGEQNPVSLASLEKALAGYTEQKRLKAPSAAANMRSELTKNFPLESLPGPISLQILLHHPRLKPLLTKGQQPLWLALAVAVLQPFMNVVDALSGGINPCKRLVNWLTPKSFMELLEEKLEESLSPTLQKKLRDPVLGHLVQDKLGRSLFLSLLTGQFVSPLKEEPPAEEIGARFAQRFIGYDAPPDVLAERFNDYLTHQLRQFNTGLLNAPLESLLEDITPESAVVARHALHQRKLGLHWRIDALKDMGDMDTVRALPDILRHQKLDEELTHVSQIMGAVADATRTIFPQSVIKAEITDLHALTPNPEGETQLMDKLLGGRTIDSIPNYKWQYSAGHKAVRMTTEPDGYPPQQLSPADYIEYQAGDNTYGSLKPMMKALPLDKAMLFENMTSNHDKSTTLFGLALHPFQARYDYLGWFGMNFNDNGQPRGAFHLALNELVHKPQMAFLTQGLPSGSIEALRTFSTSEAFQQQLAQSDPELADYCRHIDARQNPETKRAIPFEAKSRYVDTLLKAFGRANKAYASEQLQQLQTAVRQVFLEPSEVKAMRGKLLNGLQTLAENPRWFGDTSQEQTLGKQALAEVGGEFAPAFWSMLQSIPERHRRWMGYRQIDQVIDWTTNALLEKLPDHAVLKTTPQALPVFKRALYNVVMAPAFEHYKRIAALQVAIPGDPTFYLPDLLGQAGGEDLKNMYLGNREAIRFDWLKTNPLIRNFCEDLGKIILQRHQNHVLNNGQLELPLDPGRSAAEKARLDQTAILPLIRDNGTDQALCLINFGAPDSPWNTWMNSQTTPQYPELGSTKPVIKNYKLDLSHLRIPVGTTYQSVDPERPNETFVVNSNRQLVRKDNPGQGVDVHIARTLIRVS